MLHALIPFILGQEADSPSYQIGEWVARIGVTGLIGFGYWNERKERLASQERERVSHRDMIDVLERLGPVLTKATDALNSVQQSQTRVAENLTESSGALPRGELNSLMEAMNALAEELHTARKPKGV